MAAPGELGSLTLAAEDARAVLTWTWMEHLMQDLHYALRAMSHNKAFAALAVLSLMLGIGASTAIYSFMESILLRSLPVPEPKSLVMNQPPNQMTYEVRATGNLLDYADSVRQVVRQIDWRLALSEFKTQTAHIDQGISQEITLARLCSVFAVLALIIACVGLYGTVAFNITRRTKEIGIRVALGAQRARIFRMVLGDVFVMALVGLCIGAPAALIGSSYLKSLLFGIEPGDPVAITVAVVILVTAGVIAGFVPARRAARTDPIMAIRHE